MGRVSQQQAQQNRTQVVEAAARLFRERGVQGVSVAELMAAAGLTHGGFYKQFSSKEALVAEATGQAFTELGEQLTGRDDESGGHAAARTALLDYYLSPDHRDHAGEGCPTSGLAVDVAREAPGSPVRATYAEGVAAFARWLSPESPGSPESGTSPGSQNNPDPADQDLVTLSTMVGALLLSRATAGTELSDRILATVRASLEG
jgi:TetR/AcrR family transcriptional repressor of nem operon